MSLSDKHPILLRFSRSEKKTGARVMQLGIFSQKNCLWFQKKFYGGEGAKDQKNTDVG